MVERGLRSRAGPTEEICHDVIAHYHGNRNQKPKYALKCVLYDEVGWAAEHEEGDVGPGELRGREGGRQLRMVAHTSDQ